MDSFAKRCIISLSVGKRKQGVFFTILLFLIQYHAHAQSLDSTYTFHKKRFVALSALSGGGYAIGMLGLGHIWYKDQLTNDFKFFNDNEEWLLMDKRGHFFSSFLISNTSVQMLHWAGCSRKKSIWYGGLTGAVLAMPIEVFDGFSDEYGASWGDLTANTLGSVAVISQYLLWNEIRITPKFSYHATEYAPLRPNTLGSSPMERLIKDYNGQTYWLSFNLASLTQSHTIPQWLNVSLGYSAKEMVYALPSENQQHGYNSYSQGFLSLDLDLTRIKTKNKFLKSVLYTFNILHVPFPALEYNNRNGFIFHPLYF